MQTVWLVDMKDIQLVGIAMLIGASIMLALGFWVHKKVKNKYFQGWDEPQIGAIDSLFHLRGLAMMFFYFALNVVCFWLPIGLALIGTMFVLTP